MARFPEPPLEPPDDGREAWIDATCKHFNLDGDDEVTQELMDEFAEYHADMLAHQQEWHAEREREARLDRD